MNILNLNFLKRYSAFILVGIFSATFFACSDDDPQITPDPEPDPDTESIVTIAASDDNFSILVEALTLFPDLVSLLSSDGDYTVFAPTNAAFAALLDAIGQEELADVPESVLRNVLEYHVITSGAFLSTDLSSGDVVTAGGESISVDLTSGVTLNGSVNLTSADLEASNGVIHVIDGVLVPPSILPIVGTIVAPAFFNKNFTTLIAAVQAADASILELLLSDGPSDNGLTLFAPTNAAFEAAGITSLPDAETLNAVLAYHVLDGTVNSTDLPSGSAAIEAIGGFFYLSNNGANGVFINGTSEVTGFDIEGSNGVVHVIDRTLLPPTSTIAGVVTSLVDDSGEFSELLAAVLRTEGEDPDLLAAISDEDANLTVFAPTNAAFEALYTTLGVDGIGDIELGTLTAVLTHHVVGARVFSTDLSDGAVGTLNGDITINLGDVTITDGSDGVANIVSTDVHAINGVIHVIDKVLIP